MGFFKRMFNNNKRSSKRTPNKSENQSTKTFSSLQENIQYIQEALFHTEDLQQRSVLFHGMSGVLLFIQPLCDQEKIREEILKPLSLADGEKIEDIVTAIQTKTIMELEKAVDLMIEGYAVLFFEGIEECYAVQVDAIYKRDVSEPNNEKIVRGSHQGFIENTTVNLQLVRKIIKNRSLVVRRYQIGKETNTEVSIAYMQNLANPELIEEIDRRIKDINADTIVSTDFVEEYIEDESFSPFPQMLHTERPDRVVGNLMEGRAAIFADGTPTVSIVPVTFFAFYQSTDDYNSRTIPGSFIRLIRLLSFIIAINLPAYYIAVVSFHNQVIPADLFFPVKGSVEDIPYPPILEALFMELTIELLREAGIRLPGPVGQTIGIVGGLVIGDAVVKAGLVSNTMIIVVALTAIASFVVPSHDMSTSVRILRFPVMIFAALFGFVGISLSITFIVIHLCKLESFGTPYLAPMAPLRLKDWFKDVIIRLPYWKINERPIDAQPQKLQQESYSREWHKDDKRKK